MATVQSIRNIAASAVAGVLWTAVSPAAAFGYLVACTALAIFGLLITTRSGLASPPPEGRRPAGERRCSWPALSGGTSPPDGGSLGGDGALGQGGTAAPPTRRVNDRPGNSGRAGRPGRQPAVPVAIMRPAQRPDAALMRRSIRSAPYRRPGYGQWMSRARRACPLRDR
jgi:hypothetical protein